MEVIAERSRYTAIPIGTTFVVSIVGFLGVLTATIVTHRNRRMRTGSGRTPVFKGGHEEQRTESDAPNQQD